MFALEAVKARHGDCLLLHFDNARGKTTIPIDGGPAGTWTDSLKPKLTALQKERDPTAALRLPLVMVSHIDDDHINGVLEMTNEMVLTADRKGKPSFRIDRLWHNTLEGLVGLAPPAASTASVLASVAARFPDPGDQRGQKVLASIPQAERLLANARRLNIITNDGSGTLVYSGMARNIAGVNLRVLAPSRKRLQELRAAWKQHLDQGKTKDEVATAAYTDRSVYNLSSIVVLAEFRGKRMLLTGDARGDDVIAGLEDAALMDRDGRIHLDLLKLPHHGSRNNVHKDFFERVVADNYVVSGDQVDFPNPHPETIEMLLSARPAAEQYKLWMTYNLPSIEEMFPEGGCITPAVNGVSVVVDLERTAPQPAPG
jgi:beta-lactamase superfamily II metal-dependent hydrolase